MHCKKSCYDVVNFIVLLSCAVAYCERSCLGIVNFFVNKNFDFVSTNNINRELYAKYSVRKVVS